MHLKTKHIFGMCANISNTFFKSSVGNHSRTVVVHPIGHVGLPPFPRAWSVGVKSMQIGFVLCERCYSCFILSRVASFARYEEHDVEKCARHGSDVGTI